MSVVVFALAASSALAATFNPDVPAPVRTQINQDVTFLKTVQGATASGLNQQIFGGGGVSGATYVRFLSARIQTFGMSACGGGPGVIACVQPALSTSTMWLSPNYISFNMPQAVRVSVILHESRHTESAHGFWGHVNCPVPFLNKDGTDVRGIFSGAKLEGQPACDTTALGAYAAGLVFLKNLEKHCDSCTAKVKMDGKIYGDDTFKRIINPAALATLTNDLR